MVETVRDHAPLLARVAVERISYELERIMQTKNAGSMFREMAAVGVINCILPELARGAGVAQPESHHLDVLDHNIEALRRMEAIQEDPEHYFPGHGAEFAKYLERNRRRILLKWASLFHDIGKPQTTKQVDQRITFYNHDKEGERLLRDIALRLKWRRDDQKQVAQLVGLHMWPFHLSNARRKTKLTSRAYLRLVRAVGEELPGLFMLAMADSLAGSGPEKPPAMEKHLADLYSEADEVYQQSIRPVFERPRLITGHDLISSFGLRPGPVFSVVLDALQEAQVAGEVASREQAMDWVGAFLRAHGQGAS